MNVILHKLWRWGRWVLLVLVVAYAALVIYRIPAVLDKQKSDAAVAQIRGQKITYADVMGTNLPPMPSKEANDVTVAGIDKNGNGIRDDVELAIFKEYPNSAKIRAAELQYALTEEMFLTEVFDTATWKAVAEEDSRASDCINSLFPRPDLGFLTPEQQAAYLKNDLPVYIKKVEAISKEVEQLVFNSQIRNTAKNNAFQFTTSFGSAPGQICDINLSTLPN